MKGIPGVSREMGTISEKSEFDIDCSIRTTSARDRRGVRKRHWSVSPRSFKCLNEVPKNRMSVEHAWIDRVETFINFDCGFYAFVKKKYRICETFIEQRRLL